MPTHVTSAHPAARFGTTYGYRFTGDTVELQATFNLLSETAHQHQWSLQLRATPSAAMASETLVSHLIAEALLPPLSELAASIEPYSLTADTLLPAGTGEYDLTLWLVARGNDYTEEVHDAAIFPRSEKFCLPRFNGEISHQFSPHNVQFSLAAIENPRDPSNLSGTLSLELWALSAPYTGSAFRGTPLAGAIIGQLSGQQSWLNQTYDLTFVPPTPGLWHLVLMLREWTGAGYTTRDFHNLSKPLLIEPAPASENKVAAKEPSPVKETTKTDEPPAAAKSLEIVTTAIPSLKAVTATKTTAKPTPVTVVAPAPKPVTTTVSVNRATAAELAKVKGLNKTVAAAIIAGRPYASLDQLAKVKGLGAQKFAKVRTSLAL